MSVASGAVVAGWRVGVDADAELQRYRACIAAQITRRNRRHLPVERQRRRDKIRRRDGDRRQRRAVAAKALLKNLFPGVDGFGRLALRRHNHAQSR